MSSPGQDRFAKLAAAAGQGAALLGKPNVVGKVVIGVMDNGQVGLVASDFEMPMTQLLVSKMAQQLVAGIGVQVQMKAQPPGEGT